MRAKRFLAGVVAGTILLTSALTVACGGEGAGDSLSRSDVEEIVREQTSCPRSSRLTQEEVEAAVQAALDRGSGTPSDTLTLAEIREIVQDELEALPQPEPGLTMNEVEEAISAAMRDAAPTAEALSIEEVEDAIRTAVAGIPAIDPGVSTQEAEMIASLCWLRRPTGRHPTGTHSSSLMEPSAGTNRWDDSLPSITTTAWAVSTDSGT